MPSLWTSYWKILKLDPEPFETIKQANDGFWFGLKLFIIVGLIIGLGKLAGIGAIVDQPTLPEIVNQVATGIGTFAEELLPPFLAELAQEVVTVVRKIEAMLAELQPPVGTRSSRLIRLVGDWLTTPFDLLSAWLGFMLAIWIVARLMGGRGSLRHHLSLLSLAVAPQVLTLFNYVSIEPSPMDISIGIFGRLLALVAWGWSFAILIPALAIAHNVERKQAIKILVVFFVVVFVVLPVVSIFAGAYVLTGAG